MFHTKMKHIEVKYHFIKEVLDDKCIQLVKVHNDDNLADLLTKSLNPQRFAHCRGQMGVLLEILMLSFSCYMYICLCTFFLFYF